MQWSDIFEYKEGVLYWKKTGKAAGSKDGHGYLQTGYKGKRFKNHRIIWEMFNYPIPKGLQIDHINGIRSDNRIENLRLVTHRTNQRNRKTAKGYTWHKGAKKWISSITVNKKTVHIGYFDSKEQAHNAYLKAKKEYHNDV